MNRKLLDLVSLLPSLLLFLFPSSSFATVVINEIAWMGTAVSANDEWIELYNEGITVDLSGWTLTNNKTLSITLSGSIAGGEYFLLERSDNDSVPGKSADTIYTGALGNDGETLTLKRDNGTIEDEVVGGSGWSLVGGNNTTKETAQRTASGWTTGASTPKAQNVVYTPPAPPDDEEEEEEDETQTNESTEKVTVKSNSPGERITLAPSNRMLSVSIEAGSIASLNQPLILRAKAAGISEQLLSSLTYLWNFGDGMTGSGKEITHTYKHPGDYIIVLRAFYKNFEDEVRAEVTILPVTLEIMREGDGSVLVLNNAQYESDVSGYILSGGGHQFLFPDRTIIAASGALRIPDINFTSLLPHTSLMLTNPMHRLVAEYPARVASQSFTPISTEASGEPLIVEEDEAVSEDITSLPLEASVASAIAEEEGYRIFPYVGLLGLILVGSFALYTQKVT